MALDTIADIINEVRVLLQDQEPEYRYPDADLITGFNKAVMESKRLRPDMWVCQDLPSMVAAVTTGNANSINLPFDIVPFWNLTGGMYVYDCMTPGAIPYGTQAQAFTSTNVILSTPCTVPAGDTVLFSPAQDIGIDPIFRSAFIFYICGNAQLRDEEETQDTRSAAMLQAFRSMLVGGA